MRDDAWLFLNDVESLYNCAGMCYTPMFFLTKDIKNGRPEKECIREIFEDVYSNS